MRKELLLVLKLSMPEQQFKEWKRPFRKKIECLEVLESRYAFSCCFKSV
jgi:hypothetical protein